MRSIIKATIATLIAASMLSASPGLTATTVSAKLEVGTAGGKIKTTSCWVTVAEGADGVAILDAAKTAGCIRSYKLENFGWGDFVSCIDEVCGQVGTYWSMYENGAYTSYGVREFHSNAGDVLAFDYDEWATCLTPIGC